MDKEFVRQNKIRVKYLDKEDLESFGAICISDSRFHFMEDGKISYSLHLLPINNLPFIQIKEFDENDTYETAFNVFSGYIKNKSELKRILEQTGILEP